MRPDRSRRPSFPALLISAVLLGQLGWLGAPPAGRAAVPSLQVDRTDDDPSASACLDEVPADCSLRGAVLNANADQEAEIETILVPAGTYVLTTTGGGPGGGSLDVNWSASIVGSGSASTIIDGNGTDRVLLLSRPPYTGGVDVVTVSGVTIRNGSSCAGEGSGGGGAFLSGTISMRDVVFTGNTAAPCGSGGALSAYPGTTLTVDDATFRDNRASSGGALSLGGAHATLTDTTISGNAAIGSGGGGIVDEGGSYPGSLDLTRVVIAGNTSARDGGGVRSDGFVTMTDSTIDSNTATGGGGGGISQAAGSLTATRTTISRNSGLATGGGIAAGTDAGGASLTIVNSTISDNTARWYTSGTPQYFGGNGGGILGKFTAMSIINSTITGNVAENNPGDSGHVGGLGQAGGLNTGGTNYYGQYPNVEIRNSIVAGNLASTDSLSQCQFNGAVHVGSNSIVGNGCAVAGAGNQNVDPMVGALADNGGRTETRSLLAGSPALDSADATWCPATDQRGIDRPQGAGCDAGAFELEVAAPPTPEPTLAPTPEPTLAPTPEPTLAPTAEPTAAPTVAPTAAPTAPPLPTPIPSPTAAATLAPPPSISIAVDDVEVREGNFGTVPATFTLRLSGRSDATVRVTVATADDSATATNDYAALAPTDVSFTPGETEKTVTVLVKGDAIRELRERFALTLTQPVAATLDRSTAYATITEPVLGPFHAAAVGNDLLNSYDLAVLSNYVYADNAQAGTSYETFADALHGRFDDPTAGVQVMDLIENAVTGTQGAYVEVPGALIIVLRGTELPAWNEAGLDAFVDGAINQVGGIHAGFLAAATSVLDDVRAHAVAARSAGKRVWLTGHSLGGAVATVLALQLQTSGVEVQGLQTFGSPRVFSPTMAATFSLLFAARPAIRWVDNLDLVTHVPPMVLTDYVHVGVTDNIVPGILPGGRCVLQLGATERLVGADLADHASQRYIARIYENLASNADRAVVSDPPNDPVSADMRAGCDVQPLTPQQAAQAAWAAGKDALRTARTLAWDYGITAGESVAQLLLSVGFDATAVAGALRDVFGWSANKVADAFKTLKVALRDIVAAIAAVYQWSADKIAALLAKVGYTATEVAVALRQALGLGIDAIARALAAAKYAGDEAVAALQTAFGYGAQAVIDALVRAGFPIDALALGMERVYGFGVDVIARVFYFAGVSADKVGYLLEHRYQFGANLVAATLKGAGYFVSHLAAHLRTAFNLSALEVALILRDIDYKATSIMTALRDVWSKTATGAANILETIGFPATDTLIALRDVFGTGAQAGADVLAAVGYTASEAMTALRDVFARTAETAAPILAQAGYTASAIANALKSVFGKGAQAVSDILDACGFTAIVIAGALKTVFARTAAQVVSILRSTGFAAAEVAAAVKSAFSSTAAQVVSMLKSAGYTVTQVAGAVKSVFGTTASAVITLLKNAGYSVSSIGTALKDAYGRTAAQVVTLLNGAAYGVVDVAKALANAFAMTASQVAWTLWSSGLYAIDQIISAIRSVFNLSLSAAYQVMRDLGLVP